MGFRADLLVLDRDPEADIGALREPAGLVLHGAWLTGETLERYRGGGH
ncbi:MAG TPA: hypothetical protein VNH46_04595 [Gemmatimonadales bacterium]|nr:hypothetical protein [Gemmatimonadales bacterium]